MARIILLLSILIGFYVLLKFINIVLNNIKHDFGKREKCFDEELSEKLRKGK